MCRYNFYYLMVIYGELRNDPQPPLLLGSWGYVASTSLWIVLLELDHCELGVALCLCWQVLVLLNYYRKAIVQWILHVLE